MEQYLDLLCDFSHLRHRRFYRGYAYWQCWVDLGEATSESALEDFCHCWPEYYCKSYLAHNSGTDKLKTHDTTSYHFSWCLSTYTRIVDST